MLLRTYQKMLAAFQENHGYMSFSMLKEAGISVSQMREMEEQKILQRFARGWYWCNACGIDRPQNHKYIEVAKVNPNAVICMQSAAYLLGLTKIEPENIQVATERTDRKKMNFEYPVMHFYLQNAYMDGEVQKIHTEFGDFQIYGVERTICDCLRMKGKLEENAYLEILEYYQQKIDRQERVKQYAKSLRALKNVTKIER